MLLLVLDLQSWKNENLTPQFPRLSLQNSTDRDLLPLALAFPAPKSSRSQNLVPSEVHFAISTEESINIDKLRKLGVGGDIVPPPKKGHLRGGKRYQIISAQIDREQLQDRVEREGGTIRNFLPQTVPFWSLS